VSVYTSPAPTIDLMPADSRTCAPRIFYQKNKTKKVRRDLRLIGLNREGNVVVSRIVVIVGHPMLCIIFGYPCLDEGLAFGTLCVDPRHWIIDMIID